ncbi:MAG: FG-GAP-like repeat-containing protein [Gammaproteobacteria bacterium]|nr:FG-GAP-like repeat-containing protein [Gammaproteobacteria bacterium]MDH5799288.1 FG-GAP-like repeat-containing protein [Gammaproteobacteria bacterium]
MKTKTSKNFFCETQGGSSNYSRRCVLRISSVILFLAFSSFSLHAVAAPDISVGNVNVSSGTPPGSNRAINIPINFTNDGSVIALQFDVSYPDSAIDVQQGETSTSSNGLTIYSAEFSVSAGMKTTRVIFAPNLASTLIADGIIVSLPAQITTPQGFQIEIQISNVLLSNSRGEEVALTSIQGGIITLPDYDADSFSDFIDVFPTDGTEWVDFDGDGIGDNRDPDDDNDLIPDSYEQLYGLNPFFNDALEDPDNDSLTNLREFNLLTNPIEFTSAYAEGWDVTNQWGSAAFTRVGDFDGNGMVDIASVDGGNVYMKLSNGEGFNAEVWSVLNNWNLPEFTWVGDFTGDGLADFVTMATNNQIAMKISNSESFTSIDWALNGTGLDWGGSATTWVGDFDGNGLLDITSADSVSQNMKLSTGTSFSTSKWNSSLAWGDPVYKWVGDFDGDGQSDIAGYDSSNTVFVHLSRGGVFDSQSWSVPAGAIGRYNWVGDFNGDGKSDLASGPLSIDYSGTDIDLLLSTGAGFRHEKWAANIQNYHYLFGHSFRGYVWSGDFNGDGLTDLVSTNGDNLNVNYSTGSGFLQDSIALYPLLYSRMISSSPWIKDLNGWGSFENTKVGDFNGDGLLDIASILDSKVYMKIFNNRDVDDDGIEDRLEVQAFSSLQKDGTADTDTDGLTDFEELVIFHTDPTMSDTDGDGYIDKFELQHNFNPLDRLDATVDTDGDGVPDLEELTLGTDPNVNIGALMVIINSILQ